MENYIYIGFKLSGWSWVVILLVPIVIIFATLNKANWTFSATNRKEDQ